MKFNPMKTWISPMAKYLLKMKENKEEDLCGSDDESIIEVGVEKVKKY